MGETENRHVDICRVIINNNYIYIIIYIYIM